MGLNALVAATHSPLRGQEHASCKGISKAQELAAKGEIGEQEQGYSERDSASTTPRTLEDQSLSCRSQRNFLQRQPTISHASYRGND